MANLDFSTWQDVESPWKPSSKCFQKDFTEGEEPPWIREVLSHSLGPGVQHKWERLQHSNVYPVPPDCERNVTTWPIALTSCHHALPSTADSICLHVLLTVACCTFRPWQPINLTSLKCCPWVFFHSNNNNNNSKQCTKTLRRAIEPRGVCGVLSHEWSIQTIFPPCTAQETSQTRDWED